MMTNQQLAKYLFEIKGFKEGTFQLKSGLIAPFYINLRPIISYPHFLNALAERIHAVLEPLYFDHLCGVPYTALPIACCLSSRYHWPMILRRKEKKEYGTKQQIEGNYTPGDRCVIIEDLITSGSSVLETVQSLNEVGIDVTDVVVVLDREQGGKENLESKGFNIHSLVTLTELLTHFRDANHLSTEQLERSLAFVRENQVALGSVS